MQFPHGYCWCRRYRTHGSCLLKLSVLCGANVASELLLLWALHTSGVLLLPCSHSGIRLVAPHQTEKVQFQNKSTLCAYRPFISIATRNSGIIDLSSTLARYSISPLCSPQRLSCPSSSFSAVVQQVRLNVTRLVLNSRKTELINPSGGGCCCAQLHAAGRYGTFSGWDPSWWLFTLFCESWNSLKKPLHSDSFFVTVQHSRDCVSAVQGCCKLF